MTIRKGKALPTPVTHNGETHTISEWAELHGIKPRTLLARIASGWEFEKAISTPVEQQQEKASKAKRAKDTLMAMAVKVLQDNPELWEKKLKEAAEKNFLEFVRILSPFLPKEPAEKTAEKPAQMGFIAEPITNADQLKHLKPL